MNGEKVGVVEDPPGALFVGAFFFRLMLFDWLRQERSEPRGSGWRKTKE